MVERITNEEREAIVRKAVAERDALLAAKAQRPACKWPECDCGVSPAQGKAWNCPKQTAHSAAVWNSVCAPGVAAPPASKADRVPCSRCTSDIYCEMNGCQHPAVGVMGLDHQTFSPADADEGKSRG